MVAQALNFHRMAKAEKTGLSLTPQLRAEAQERANLRNRGNFSAYVQDLIAADLAGVPANTAFSPTILAELARTYGGYFAPRLAAQLEAQGIDQPKLLHSLLRDLCEVAASDCHLEEAHVAPDICISADIVPIAQRAYPPAKSAHYPSHAIDDSLAVAEPAGDPTEATAAADSTAQAQQAVAAPIAQTPPAPRRARKASNGAPSA